MSESFDHKMKSLAGGFAIPTADKNLARFSRRLRYFNFFKPRFNSFNIYTSVAVIGTFIGSAIVIQKTLNAPKTNTIPVKELKSLPCPDQNKSVPFNVQPKIQPEPQKKENKIIKQDSITRISKRDTLKITVNDTVQNNIKVLVKDTVKIKKKIKRTRE